MISEQEKKVVIKMRNKNLDYNIKIIQEVFNNGGLEILKGIVAKTYFNPKMLQDETIGKMFLMFGLYGFQDCLLKWAGDHKEPEMKKQEAPKEEKPKSKSSKVLEDCLGKYSYPGIPKEAADIIEEGDKKAIKLIEGLIATDEYVGFINMVVYGIEYPGILLEFLSTRDKEGSREKAKEIFREILTLAANCCNLAIIAIEKKKHLESN